MKKRKLFLFLFILFIPSMVFSSIKGCINVYEDGTKECRNVRFGHICDLMGQKITINGKRVVRMYQVLNCKGYDNLGRKVDSINTQDAFLQKCESKKNCLMVLAGKRNNRSTILGYIEFDRDKGIVYAQDEKTKKIRKFRYDTSKNSYLKTTIDRAFKYVVKSYGG